jgi:ribosomal silencing factor RsfS
VSLIAADGLEGREWVVLDFGVYMIHLMLPEARVHINMEEHLKSLKRGDFHRDE